MRVVNAAGAGIRGGLPLVTQLFWPDRSGRFPWEDGVDDYCRTSQPMLRIPKSETEGPWSRVA
jgi:hypothetical protein